MARYVIFFSYANETWQRMISNPGDRTAAIKLVIDTLGGSLDNVYWTTGSWDGIVIVNLPGITSAAATGALIRSTGAFKDAEVHEVLDQDQLGEALQLAGSVDAIFRRPGQ